MRWPLVCSILIAATIGCKSLPTAKKPEFKPDSDLKARFKMYDENRIEHAKGLFKLPYNVGDGSYNGPGIAPLFEQDFVSPEIRSQFNSGSQYELWGGALSATGAALGIVGLLEDTSDASGSHNQLGYYLGGLGVSLVGIVLQGIGANKVAGAISAYNHALRLRAAPELAANGTAVEIRNFAYLQHRF
jgi:hypothetical protein